MVALMAEEVVKLELRQLFLGGGSPNAAVAEVTVNRPQSLNALNADVLQSILLTFKEIEKNRDVRAVIVTGAGEKSFVAGADIAMMSQLGARAIADYVELGQRAMRSIELCRVPVIAAVNGFALGGGMELALACDIVLAATQAKFGQPEINLGIIPGFGGTQRLAFRCGIGATRRLVLTGEMITAEEALRIGLVDKVLSAEELIPQARAMGELIAKKAPLAVQEAKRVVRLASEPALLCGLRYEVDAFLSLFSTFDRDEGMNAFLQKREAKFQGR